MEPDKMITRIICTLFLIDVVVSDFYVGMFEKDDYLVSREFVFKQAAPGTRVTAEYGRLYKCPITYIHVKDKVDMFGGPVIKIVKGGLRSKFFAMRITSPPNLPISVDISVACPSPHGPVENEGINPNSTVDYDAEEEQNKGDESNNNTRGPGGITDDDPSKNNNGESGKNKSTAEKDADSEDSGGSIPPESPTTEQESSVPAAQDE